MTKSRASSFRKPSHIPDKFYAHVLWSISIYEHEKSTLDLTVAHNKKVAHPIALDRISYLSNLLSDDNALKGFYAETANNPAVLTGVFCIFEKAPEWIRDYKISRREEVTAIAEVKKHLLKAAVLLREAPDVRFDIQDYFERHMGQVVDMKSAREKMIGRNGNPASHPYIIDFTHILHLLSSRLTDIEPQAAKRKSYVKKIRGQDAIVFYVARRLKELFEAQSVNKRKHVKYITDLINVVMRENTSEDRIRKLMP